MPSETLFRRHFPFDREYACGYCRYIKKFSFKHHAFQITTKPHTQTGNRRRAACHRLLELGHRTHPHRQSAYGRGRRRGDDVQHGNIEGFTEPNRTAYPIYDNK